MSGPPIVVRERDDVGFELFLGDEARRRITGADAKFQKLARDVWWSEHEAIAVANRLTEELFGRFETHSETHGGEYDVG